jgi:hypothetical protein
MKKIKNSFIAFALCMGGNVPVHGVNSASAGPQILRNMLGKKVVDVGTMALMHVRNNKADSSLGKVNKDPLQNIVQYMHDLSWQSEMCHVKTDMGAGDLPVARIRADDTIVAARIDDNRNGAQNENYVYDAQVKQLISDLQHQHGSLLPIQVHIPHRQASFFGVTGKLYSDADTVEVYNSHDLDVYIKPGGQLKTQGHSGRLRTNAGDISLWAPGNDVTMICDNGNKKVTISTDVPNDKPVTVKLDNFQGKLKAVGPQTAVKVENSHCERADISDQAKALFDHTTITGNIKGGLDVVGHASLVLFGSNVEGPIRGTSNSDVFKVDSNGTVCALNFQDGAQQCGEYTVFSQGNLHNVPDLMAQEIARKNPDNTQKEADTVQKFNALWAKRQMPNQNAQEESQE